jgi:hypothetical protein
MKPCLAMQGGLLCWSEAHGSIQSSTCTCSIAGRMSVDIKVDMITMLGYLLGRMLGVVSEGIREP